jgi:hypothetical protein
MFKVLLTAALAAVGASQYTPPPSFGNMTNSTTFMNPIVGTGADP